MSTFQHAPFIRKAIEGVLMQQTKFRIELVIADDLSTDGTREICEELQQKNAAIIRLLPSDKKYGQNENLSRVIQAGTGRYIALCEGDDYWTHPLKLQRQVDFMDTHPYCAQCFHRIDTVNAEGRILEKQEDRNQVTFYSGKEVFHIFIPTPSIIFRNCLQDFPPEFFKIKSTDAFLCAMLTGYGAAADLGFSGSVYRKHEGGLYNRLSMLNRYKQSIYTRKLMKRSAYFNDWQKREIRKELIRREIMYLKSFLKKRQFRSFFDLLFFFITNTEQLLA